MAGLLGAAIQRQSTTEQAAAAQRRARGYLPGQDGVPQRGSGLLGGGLPLDGRAKHPGHVTPPFLVQRRRTY